jgi:hypothetical protein
LQLYSFLLSLDFLVHYIQVFVKFSHLPYLKMAALKVKDGSHTPIENLIKPHSLTGNYTKSVYTFRDFEDALKHIFRPQTQNPTPLSIFSLISLNFPYLFFIFHLSKNLIIYLIK